MTGYDYCEMFGVAAVMLIGAQMLSYWRHDIRTVGEILGITQIAKAKPTLVVTKERAPRQNTAA